MPKIKLYLYHEQWVNCDSEPTIVPWHVKLLSNLDDTKIRIFIKEVEVDIPEVTLLEEAEVKQAMLAGLREQKKDLQAEVQVKLDALDDKIQQLLAITYTPAVEEAGDN